MASIQVTNTRLVELLLHQISEFAVIVCDTEGTFVSWHPGVFAHLGYTADEFIGRNRELLCPPLERESCNFRETLRAAAETGPVSARLRLAKKNGEDFWADCLTIALRDPDGILLGFGEIFSSGAVMPPPHAAASIPKSMPVDLHMQRELETANERLKRMANELQRSNEELAEFARIASHDLSAPIISTRWLVDSLSARYGRQLDGEGRKCLKQISQSLDRMADLVQAILTHAQVGMSSIGSSEETDADDALRISLENLRRDIETSGAQVLHEPLPALLIRAQPLTQLFQNLLSNAIKYRRPGVPPLVRVIAERRGTDWLISVRDNGIGIEPAWTERIFLPLQRPQGMQVEGSGIGLATCMKIVTRAGGRIWVESELGIGSVFYITFPAAEQASAAGK